MKPIIGITIGDPAGIGPEITAKAVMSGLVKRLCRVIIIGPGRCIRPLLRRYGAQADILESSDVPGHVILYGKPQKAAGFIALQAFRTGITLCKEKKIHALVTSPLSKRVVSWNEPGFKGHTEMLAEAWGIPRPIMMMQAKGFRFVMVTRHLPIGEVEKKLTVSLLVQTIEDTCRILTGTYQVPVRRPVVCALNPHAGEDGLLGKTEKKTIIPALERLRRKKIPIIGPLAADAAIRDMFRKKYDLCFGMYHDQIMIPLKAVYPSNIVNITLGLPCIRTSPGHGVAYDIAGKNKADEQPMIHAIKTAVEYVSRKHA